MQQSPDTRPLEIPPLEEPPSPAAPVEDPPVVEPPTSLPGDPVAQALTPPARDAATPRTASAPRG